MKSDTLKELLKSFKNDSPVLGPVHRHLMSLDPWEDRRRDVIHPSELASDDFCPRAIWYRLMGDEEKREVVPLTREIIFAAGHEYHEKWQGWLWDAGRLEGRFNCLSCGAVSYGVALQSCEACDAPKRMLKYGEVRAASTEHNIYGHADGIVVDMANPVNERLLMEVKSVGEGTIRIYDPDHLRRFQVEVNGRKVLDHRKMWDAIKTPFLPHIRQVTIYGRLLGIDRAVIIYEYKPTGQVKEFVINLRFEAVESRFEAARSIMDATRTGVAPTCSKRGGGCSNCLPFESEKTDEQTEEESGSARASRRQRRRDAARQRAGSLRASAGASAEPASGDRHARRQGPDGAVQGTRRLVRLREHAAERGDQ